MLRQAWSEQREAARRMLTDWGMLRGTPNFAGGDRGVTQARKKAVFLTVSDNRTPAVLPSFVPRSWWPWALVGGQSLPAFIEAAVRVNRGRATASEPTVARVNGRARC